MTLIDGSLASAAVMASSGKTFYTLPSYVLVLRADNLSYMAMPGSVWPDLHRIELHGPLVSSSTSSCIFPAELLPSNIKANEILRS
jgi:hypothetical protein